MTEPWVVGLAVNVLVLISSFVAVTVRMTWKAAQTKAEIIAAINNHAKEDEAEFAQLRREINASAHDFGETIAALKEHVNTNQLEALKLFVRRDGFYETMKSITESMASLRGELSNGMVALRSELRSDIQRLEGKIDSRA